jgi:HK97 family phage prohead protease
MEEKKIKSLPAPTEYHVKADGRTFEGYASVFGVLDSYQDIVMPGAFTDTVRTRLPQGLVKVLWQHNPDSPIGKPVRLLEDSHGLFQEGKLSATVLGKDVSILMKDGVIDRLSIGYRTLDADNGTAEELGLEGLPPSLRVTLLKRLTLYEYSPVTFAANEDCTISAVKSAGAWVCVSGLKEGCLVQYRNAKGEVRLGTVCAVKGGDEYEIRGADDSLFVIHQRELVTPGNIGVKARTGTEDALRVKAGRVISTKNLERLEAAHSAIGEVIASAKRYDEDEEDEEGKGNAPAEEEEEEGTEDASKGLDMEKVGQSLAELAKSIQESRQGLPRRYGA